MTSIFRFILFNNSPTLAGAGRWQFRPLVLLSCSKANVLSAFQQMAILPLGRTHVSVMVEGAAGTRR